MLKSKKESQEKLEEIHKQAIKRFEASYSVESDQRDECTEDLLFCWVKGYQWSDSDIESRGTRPRLEINKVKVPVAQYLGEQRQKRVDVKIRPHSQGADQATADILNGLVRAINSTSNFDAIKDQASKEQATGGIGAWYVTTQYADDGFDQEIVIKPILSAASSVYYDPSAKQSMKQDSSWMMVTEEIDIEDFRKRYPDKAENSLNSETQISSGWSDYETIRIADYWVKEEYKQKVFRMSDGSIFEDNEEFRAAKDELALEGIYIIDERKIDKVKVKMYKISASEVLEGPFEWAGKYIPVVIVFGFSTWVEGKHYYQGMVRDSKDPQRVYNFTSSANLEAVAMAPKDPIFVTPTQIAGHENVYANYNNRNTPFMPINPDPEFNGGAPMRLGAPSVQQAMIAQIQQADMDIQSTTGVFSPSLGNEQQDQSGRALLALQHRGSLGTYELEDNLNKAIEYTGTILLDLIPKIYDTERDVTIFGVDSTATPVTINKDVYDQQTQKNVVLNNIAKGKYILEASTSPAFETQKIESVNTLTRLAESNPNLAPLLTDIIVGALDMPYSQELTQRVRKQMVEQGLVEPTQDELATMQGQLEAQSKQQQAVQELQMENQMLNNELLKSQILDIQEATKKRTSDLMQDRVDRLETVADTLLKVSQSLENKISASKVLDEQGIQAQVPITDELKVSAILNEELNQMLATDPFIQ